MYIIHLAKELFKFSCSHFTILSPERSERLHGHNYQVKVDIAVKSLDPQLGMAFDFNLIKPVIRSVCETWDERILLPLRSPYLKIKDSPTQIEAIFAQKRYVFPREDAVCLNVTNITCEELARLLGETLWSELQVLAVWEKVEGLQVNIEETRGQSVTFAVQK